YAYTGASHYVIQAASDPAFANVLRSQTVAGNLTSIQFALPAAPDQTHFYLRVLPQRGSVFGVCDNVLHVKTDKNAILPAMKSPLNGTNFAFKKPFAVFEWKAGTLNMDLVDHFEFWFTEKTSSLASVTTVGKVFDVTFQDPLKFDDKLGFKVQVLAVGPYGAKSALSAPFEYNVCPDHPEIIFPADLIGKVDPFQNFNIQWHNSFWFDPGSQYLVTIEDAATGIPLPGFNNKPTTATSMPVPAGTLTNGKQFTVSVRNSSSCPDILLTENIFLATGNGGSNQPQPPKLVNFKIEIKGFRNDPDGTVFPPAWGTSNFRFGIRLIDPDGNDLALVDANGNPVAQLDIDSENSGVIIQAQNRPEGKYKLKLEITDIFDPFSYYPFDQPRFSVLLNDEPIVTDHVITIDLVNPDSQFNEFKPGFKYPDIDLSIK
ncbi:MAG: hypothetical protein J7599_24900, partial [Niabella sp.]|nr:hypothetical protein [Niabella sp.]